MRDLDEVNNRLESRIIRFGETEEDKQLIKELAFLIAEEMDKEITTKLKTNKNNGKRK